MIEVIGVRFKKAGKIYYFDPGSLQVEEDQAVIVETARGIEYGIAAIGNRPVEEKSVVLPLKPVLRVADEADKYIHEKNKKKAKDAIDICQVKVNDHKLEMKLVDCEFTFDNSKVIFYFTADGRVDFRMLVKDLAAIFRMRIELRQIGVRDEAKIVGGLGQCGLPCCCKRFLGDFAPVSIKMAKEQSLSLNPTKISGVCGRLMCCLNYEHATYVDYLKQLPHKGQSVQTPEGKGVVIDRNVLEATLKVKLVDSTGAEYEQVFPLSELSVKRCKHQQETGK